MTVNRAIFEPNRREKWGLWIGVTGVFVPSLLISGFTPFTLVHHVPLWCWMVISGLSGGIGAAVYHHEFRRSPLPAFIGGTISGLLIPFTIYYYVMLRSGIGSTYHTLEFMLAASIGSIPGIVVFLLLRRAGARRGR